MALQLILLSYQFADNSINLIISIMLHSWAMMYTLITVTLFISIAIQALLNHQVGLRLVMLLN